MIKQYFFVVSVISVEVKMKKYLKKNNQFKYKNKQGKNQHQQQKAITKYKTKNINDHPPIPYSL